MDEATSPDVEPDPERPSARLQIGSQRVGDSADEAKAQPTVVPEEPRPAEKKPKHYPPPNTRDALTPELEAEYLAALGGESLDDLIDGGASEAATGELAPETRLTGRVSKIFREDVFIELDGPNQGIVSTRQFEELPDPGTEIELLVSRFNAEEGLYELTRPTVAVDVGDWSDVQEGQIVEPPQMHVY